jgi:hypothetical protein
LYFLIVDKVHEKKGIIKNIIMKQL